MARWHDDGWAPGGDRRAARRGRLGRGHQPLGRLRRPDALGPVTAIVMAHCESVDSSILDTTVESFDRHVAVNARAVWLLIA